MQRKLFAAMFYEVTLFVAVAAVAQQKPTVDQIVDNHIQALGGKANVDAVHSISYRLTYREGSFAIPDAYMAKMRPYYRTLGDPKNLRVDVNEGYDGSAWEYYSDPGVVIRTVGAAAAATRHGLEMIDSLVDYKTQGTQIDMVGIEPFAGQPAYRLHVTLADGFEKDMFVDSHSFLIVGDRRAAKVHAFGDEVKSENRWSDYRAVNGVLFPYSNREVEIATGKELNSSTMQSITVNEKFDVSYFSPPQFERTPFQQTLEQLYMERTDPVCVMSTYRGFRAAHPDVETRAGVEFIGYQMLKMGDFKGATGLLQANAADYPDSASAQYGLGRAYQASGDSSHAREAYAKALQIDPHFKRASDGLNALR